MNRINIIIGLILIICLFACSSKKKNSETENLTEVLVVGTIHGSHRSNPNYSFQDFLNILGTFDPDVICVEIPPSYFRKRSYLLEMMIGTIYGFDNDKDVYPIDWWTPGNDRARRSEYMKTDEYKAKEKQADEMEKLNNIMQNFEREYGSMDDIWNNNKMGHAFFNGKDYNDYIKEMYAVSMAVYGDGPMNLSYETRNTKMMELIKEVINKHEGERIIVLTGAEHKHYFDIALLKQDNMEVLDFNNIFPLKEEEVSDNISDFLERRLARGYYDASDLSSIDVMYSEALSRLTHGPDMDSNPDIIPPENIEKANSIIDEWETQHSGSAYLRFEKGWVEFVEGNYKQTVISLKSMADELDEIPEHIQWFVKPFYYRNLGLSYDMLGERQKAKDSYRMGEIVCKKMELDESRIKKIYKDYGQKPYKRRAK